MSQALLYELLADAAISAGLIAMNIPSRLQSSLGDSAVAASLVTGHLFAATDDTALYLLGQPNNLWGGHLLACENTALYNSALFLVGNLVGADQAFIGAVNDVLPFGPVINGGLTLGTFIVGANGIRQYLAANYGSNQVIQYLVQPLSLINVIPQ